MNSDQTDTEPNSRGSDGCENATSDDSETDEELVCEDSGNHEKNSPILPDGGFVR